MWSLFRYAPPRSLVALLVSTAVILFILLVAVGVARGGSRSLRADIPFRQSIEAAARKYGVDPCLLAGIVRQESNFDPRAIRLEPKLGTGPDGLPAASIGLAQVLVSTARDFRPGISRAELFEVRVNLEVAAELVRWLSRNGVSMPLGVDAYNMGIGNYRKGRRNLKYRDRVVGFSEEFCQ